MLELLRKSWWTISLRGLFIVAFGVLAIMNVQQANEGQAITIAFTIFLKLGFMFALSGALFLFVGIAFRKKLSNWFVLVLTGLPDLVLAGYIFLKGQDAAMYFAKIMGVWVIIVGLALLIAAIRVKFLRIVLGISGLVCIGFGLFVLLNKLISLIVVYGTISYFTVLLGIVIIALGFMARKLGRNNESPSTETQSTAS